jgi:hypothetical protein
MATIPRPSRSDKTDNGLSVTLIGPEELARRNAAAVALLDSWEAEGDEEAQRETMAALREALGERRTLSSGPAFR